MIKKLDNISPEQLETIRKTIGEAFVSNELFHNWGSESERRDDVLKYMSIYKDYADMYQHFGCELYNTVTADNGVTRYSLCYNNDSSADADKSSSLEKI